VVDDDIQRWTAKRRTALVVSIIKGETSVQEAARKHGITVDEIEKWMELAMAGMENQLRSRPKEEDALKDERIKQLERKVGQMTLDMDILKEAVRPYRPSEGRTSDE
jgi:transposase-like protein